MSTVPADVQRVLDGMTRSTAEAAARARDIEDAVRSSPYLQQRMSQAITAGHLKHISADPSGGQRLGAFNDERDTVLLSPTLFAGQSRQARLDGITDVLGHEVMHGVISERREDKNETIYTRAYQLSASNGHGSGVIDATPLVASFIERSRIDEAAAEIEGWNSVRSRIEQELGREPTVSEVARRVQATNGCVVERNGALTLAPGFKLDGSMIVLDKNRQSLEAMGQCYFDGSMDPAAAREREPAHRYAGAALSYVLQAEAAIRKHGYPPNEIHVDFKRIGLDADQVERAGVYLAPGARKPMDIVDISNPDQPRTLTIEPRSGPGQRTPNDHPTADARTPGHPDHALFTQVRAGVERLDASLGRTLDASSEAMTASLFALAKERGFRQVDRVVLSIDSGNTRAGENVFIVQGDMDNPAKLRSHIPTAVATTTPPEQSMARAAELPSVTAAQPIEHRQEQQQTVERVHQLVR